MIAAVMVFAAGINYRYLLGLLADRGCRRPTLLIATSDTACSA